MHPQTISDRKRLYLLARVVIVRHYRQELTLMEVARALASSPRQVQRAFAQFGETTFQEDLLARRMSVGTQLLVEQRSIPVDGVARLVGYSDGPHFARAFRRRYGLSPARFRAAALVAQRERASDAALGAQRERASDAALGPQRERVGHAAALQAEERS